MLKNFYGLIENTNSNIENTIRIISIIMAIYHIVAMTRPIFPPEIHQTLHLGFALIIIFLIGLKEKKSSNILYKIIDFILFISAIGVTAYLFFEYQSLIVRIGKPTTLDTIVGCIILLLILEGVRRQYGWGLMGLGLFALLYSYYGRYFPGFFYHSGYGFTRLISTMTTSFTGYIGIILQVSSTFLILFMILGAYFVTSGGGKFYVEIASAIGGRLRSGPAMAALISSAIMGSINGSGIANVSTTGVFSLPLMKSKGYSPEFAAAVEASSSNGGMFLPPVMGAGAFVMSGITGIPYAIIAAAAIIPALIYYISIGFSIHFRALHLDLASMKPEEIPDIRKVLKEGGHFLLPIFAIIYYLVRGFSPVKAATMGILSLIIVTIVRESLKDHTYLTKLGFLKPLFDAFEMGIKTAVGLAAICAMMGLIAHTVGISGLSFKIVFLITNLTAGNELYALFLIMSACIIFGMGVPPTTAYLLVAILGAPALIQMGFSTISIHLFIYFYCVMANLTPPIAPAVMVAARMAGSKSYVKTCIESIRLSFPGFLLPFLFVYHPAVLGIGKIDVIIRVSLTILLGVISISISGEGFIFRKINNSVRIALLLGGLLLVIPGIATNIIGAIILFIIIWMQIKNRPALQNL